MKRLFVITALVLLVVVLLVSSCQFITGETPASIAEQEPASEPVLASEPPHPSTSDIKPIGREQAIDNAVCRALADSLGDVLTAVMTAPERIIITTPEMEEAAKFDFAIPDDWGLLHGYEMAALGYRDEGETRFLVIALYYQDESAAKTDGAVIIKRMETYTLGTWLPQMEKKPFSQKYKAGESVTKKYPEGVVLTIPCQLMPEERRGIYMDMGGLGGGLRDFLFLAPNPSVYVVE